MQFPKIPDSEEIAAMVTAGLAPMQAELTTIRELLQEQNRLLARPRQRTG